MSPERARKFFKATGNKKKYKRNIIEEARQKILKKGKRPQEPQRRWRDPSPDPYELLTSGNSKEQEKVLREQANKIRRRERYPTYYYKQELVGDELRTVNKKGNPQKPRIDNTLGTTIFDDPITGRGWYDKVYHGGNPELIKEINEDRKDLLKRQFFKRV